MLSVDCLLMEVMDFGVPPSMERDNVWSDATNSTAWKLPSFTVSTLPGAENKGGGVGESDYHATHPSRHKTSDFRYL